MAAVLVFATGPEAFAAARVKARYGHRNWLVWRLADGSFRSAPLTLAAVEAAAAGAVDAARGAGHFAVLGAGTGVGTNVHPALAAVWLDTLRAGHRVG